MNKACTTCQETKDESEFYRNQTRIRSECKTCISDKQRAYKARNKEAVKARYRAWYEANRERVLARQLKNGRKYRAENKERIRLYTKSIAERRSQYMKDYVATENGRKRMRLGVENHRRRNRLKANTRATTQHAIRDGRLVRMPCEKCGHDKVEAHHDDYSKPFEVRWLCRKHHLEHHYNERWGLSSTDPVGDVANVF